MISWNRTEGWKIDANEFEVAAAVLVLALIAFGLRHFFVKRRRRASLRRGDDGVYVWIEIDGSPGRSRDDPRDKWDAEGSADGDSGGGD